MMCSVTFIFYNLFVFMYLSLFPIDMIGNNLPWYFITRASINIFPVTKLSVCIILMSAQYYMDKVHFLFLFFFVLWLEACQALGMDHFHD